MVGVPWTRRWRASPSSRPWCGLADEVGGVLYIRDDSGVSEIDLAEGGTVEQRVGAALDDVFLNNLSRRSAHRAA